MGTKYLAIDTWGWAEDEDFLTAIQKREKDSGMPTTMNVFSFNAEIETYSIAWFVPQIKGAVLVMQREYDKESEKFTYTFPNYILTDKDMEKKS